MAVMRRWRRWIIAILLIGAWLGHHAWSQARVTPPSHVRTFEDLVRWRSPKRVMLFETEGRTWLIAYGPGAGIMPSGPSAYVFDSTGRLVDWAVDSGDDYDFQQRWSHSRAIWDSRRDVTPDDARAWIGSATTRPASSETSLPARRSP